MKKSALFSILLLQIFYISSINAATIWSIGGGLWSTTSTTGPDCGCTPSASDDIIVDDLGADISSTMDLTGSLTIKNGGELTFSGSRNLVPKGNSTVLVESGGSLIITGGLFPKEFSDVTVEDGGSIEITGRLEITQNSTVTIGGTIVMNGDKMTVTNVADLIIESTGHLDLPNGRMDINSTGTLTVDGTIDIFDEFKLSGTMTGTGVITHASGECQGNGTINGYDENEFCDAELGGIIPLSTLPVELLYFKGINRGDQNIIQWATTLEKNNDFFTIERSNDGFNYSEMAIIPGAGSINFFKKYQWIDKYPFHGLNYYRLKQTDYNGQYAYSKIIAVKTEFNTTNVQLFPNPIVDEEINILIRNHSNGKVVLNIYSSFGKKILTSEYSIHNGAALIKVDQTPQLQPGYYFVEVILNETSAGRFKLIKRN